MHAELTQAQPVLWSDIDREKRERVRKIMDGLNVNLGRGTLRILSAGKAVSWKLRAEYRSPRWTTPCRSLNTPSLK